ncbi:unnamed protein product [Gordionus sp. m RMFG-2023]
MKDNDFPNILILTNYQRCYLDFGPELEHYLEYVIFPVYLLVPLIGSIISGIWIVYKVNKHKGTIETVNASIRSMAERGESLDDLSSENNTSLGQNKERKVEDKNYGTTPVSIRDIGCMNNRFIVGGGLGKTPKIVIANGEGSIKASEASNVALKGKKLNAGKNIVDSHCKERKGNKNLSYVMPYILFLKYNNALMLLQAIRFFVIELTLLSTIALILIIFNYYPRFQTFHPKWYSQLLKITLNCRPIFSYYYFLVYLHRRYFYERQKL